MSPTRKQQYLTVDDVRFESPQFPVELIDQVALAGFGVTGQLTDLGGERDQNTRICSADGKQFVLKISSPLEDPQTVDFQVRALLHIESRDSDLPVPRVIKGPDGKWVQILVFEDHIYQVRLLSYLSGIPYSRGPFPSPGGLHGIGAFLARLDRALSDFTHPASGAFMPWDIGSELIFSDQFRDLVPVEAKQQCLPMLDDLERKKLAKLEGLRRQVIHQDAHGGNLLRAGDDSEEVVGMIDFGDMIDGPLISDLAVCASHFMETAADIHGTATALCQGFHSVTPLMPEETDVLLDLVVTRQILTLQLYEFRRLNMPHDPPQDLDEKPRVIASLQRLASVDRKAFQEDLRSACRSWTKRKRIEKRI